MTQPLKLTLAVLKPDLLMRPRTAETVRKLILGEGFYVVRSAFVKWNRDDAKQFYLEHEDRFFYHRLVTYMCSAPVNPLILAHTNAIEKWREMMGPTKSYFARRTAPHTIRGMYGLTDTQNSTHGADSDESVRREVSFFFPEFCVDSWYQSAEPVYRSGTVRYCHSSGVHKPIRKQDSRNA